MFGLINKIFIGLLIGKVSAFNHEKYLSLSNQMYDSTYSC